MPSSADEGFAKLKLANEPQKGLVPSEVIGKSCGSRNLRRVSEVTKSPRLILSSKGTLDHARTSPQWSDAQKLR